METLTTVISFTLVMAASSTLLMMLPAVAIAYLLARYEFAGKAWISALVSLPLVLPPTAAGYLLLRLLADNGLLGKNNLGLNIDLLFTWKAVIIACSVMSFPLMVRTARVSFEMVNPRLEAISCSLGNSRLHTFFQITLPLAKRGLLAAGILGFTRAMGEFGASIIIAGNIPGKTQTLATAIYSAQQAGDQARADSLLLIALIAGFAAIVLTEWLASHKDKPTNSKAAT